MSSAERQYRPKSETNVVSALLSKVNIFNTSSSSQGPNAHAGFFEDLHDRHHNMM